MLSPCRAGLLLAVQTLHSLLRKRHNPPLRRPHSCGDDAQPMSGWPFARCSNTTFTAPQKAQSSFAASDLSVRRLVVLSPGSRRQPQALISYLTSAGSRCKVELSVAPNPISIDSPRCVFHIRLDSRGHRSHWPNDRRGQHEAHDLNQPDGSRSSHEPSMHNRSG